MKPVFLDTNIVLDLLDSQRENHKPVKQLLTQLIENEYQITISEDMLSTIFYITNNKQATLNFFKLIHKEWNIVPFGKDTISQAIERCLESPGQDFEETLQCLCAKNTGCEFLISRDSSFVDCGLRVLSIKAFLDQEV